MRITRHLRGDLLRGVTGAVIAGALLFYLLRRSVRGAFHCAAGAKAGSWLRPE